MTAQRYYVKRPNGKVFGPFDPNAIRMMIKGNKLGTDAQLSVDKSSWSPIGHIPEFSDLGGASDLPTPAGLDLPRPSPPGIPDLPRPASPGGMDLPRSAGVSDLPRPAAPGGMDLPRAAGPGGMDLPRPTAPSDLPGTAGGPMMPPSNDDLFGSPTGGSISQEDSLFGGPAPSGPSDDDLFGGPMSAPQHGNDDDLFGGPMSAPQHNNDDDLFGGPSPQVGHQESDLFGAPPVPPSMGNQESDLFGGPASMGNDDDLFGGPAPALGGGDDLFGAPQVGGQASEADLFGDAGDDDFLGGDQGFSFLDENPSALDSPPQTGGGPQLGGQDSWGDDLLGGQASDGNWEDDLLSHNQTGAAPAAPATNRIDLDAMEPHQRPPASGPTLQPGDPMRPASTGLPEHLQRQLRSGAVQPEPEPKKADGEDKRSKLPLPVIAIAGVILLGGIGFAVYQAVFAQEDGPAKVVTTKKKFVVDLDKVKSARHAELREIYTKGKKASPSPEQQAKIVLAESVFLSRYDDPEITKDATKRASGLKGNDGLTTVAKNALLAATGDYAAARDALDPLSGPSEVGYYAQLFSGIADVKELEAMAEKTELSLDDPKKKAPEKAPAPEKEGEKDDAPAETVGDGEDAQGADAGTEPEPEPEPEKSPVQERYEHALTAFGGAAETDATMPMFWKGRLHEALGEEDKALTAYKKSLETSDSYVPSLVGFGRLSYSKGDLNEATTAFEKINKELSAYASNDERGEALHYMGMVHSARSQSELAIDLFTKALSVDSTRTSTLRALAEEYERAQKYKEALNFFKTNAKLGQKDPDVMLGIVRAHMGLKEWPKAISQLEVGEKAFPTDARFPFFLGQLNMKRGTFYEAQKALERAVEIDPTLLMAHSSLAQLAWRTEKDMVRGEEHVASIVERPKEIDARVATEVAEFYRMADKIPVASQWYRAAIDKDPNYWPARLSLSKLLLQEDQTERALKLLERSRSEGVKDIRLSAYLADAYRQSKLFDKAIDEIGVVIEKFPKTPEYIFIRGNIYFDRGSYDNAMGDFNKAYELNPSYHEAYFFVGRTWFQKGDSATALKMFRHVLDYQPNNGKFRYYMGVALESEERLQQALEEYRKVTEVDPGYGVRNPQVYISRGRLLSRLGYSRDGKKDLVKALELAPENVEALVAMGEADFRDQDYDASIKNFAKALSKTPKRPKAQYQLGMAHIYQKSNRDAARHLQLAVKYGYKDPEVYETLGYLYKDLGRRPEARTAFKTFLKETEGKGIKIPQNTRREVLSQIKDLGG